MPSNFPSGLRALIASGWVKSYPALDLIFRDTTQLHYSTVNITVGAVSYVDKLDWVGSLKMSLTRPADRCEVRVNNVDGAVGQALVVPTSALSGCRANLSRIYVNLQNSADSYIIRRLTGMFLTDAKSGDTLVKGVVLSDIYAAGLIAGNVEVKPTCAWRYKDPDTCTYSGSITTCDLTLDGPNGCIAHHGGDLARAVFGGHGLFLDEQSLAQFQDLRDPLDIPRIGGRLPNENDIQGPYQWRIGMMDRSY